jgi:hypothetical protein
MAISVAGEGNLNEMNASGVQAPLELRETLRAACRQHGYRRLELESCHFSHADRGFSTKFFGKPTQKLDSYEVSSMIDADVGSITMFEANV